MFPGKAAGNTCAGFGRSREAGPLAEEEKKHEAGTACVRAWNPKTDVYVPGATGLWECRSMECGGTDLKKGDLLSRPRCGIISLQMTNSQSTFVSLKST